MSAPFEKAYTEHARLYLSNPVLLGASLDAVGRLLFCAGLLRECKCEVFVDESTFLEERQPKVLFCYI